MLEGDTAGLARLSESDTAGLANIQDDTAVVANVEDMSGHISATTATAAWFATNMSDYTVALEAIALSGADDGDGDATAWRKYSVTRMVDGRSRRVCVRCSAGSSPTQSQMNADWKRVTRTLLAVRDESMERRALRDALVGGSIATYGDVLDEDLGKEFFALRSELESRSEKNLIADDDDDAALLVRIRSVLGSFGVTEKWLRSAAPFVARIVTVGDRVRFGASSNVEKRMLSVEMAEGSIVSATVVYTRAAYSSASSTTKVTAASLAASLTAAVQCERIAIMRLKPF